MNWVDYLRKGFRSLMLHRLRSLLSTLGVLFGVVAVVAMLSIGEGAKQETLEQIEQLGMNNVIIRQTEMSEDQHIKAREKRSYGLTLEDAKTLGQSVKDVDMIAPVKVIEASITGTQNEISPEVLAVTRTYGAMKNLQMAEGRFIADGDVNNRNLVCVLGAEVARALGKYGHVGQTVRLDNLEFRVIGVLNSKTWTSGKNSALTTRNLNKSIFIPLGAESSLPKLITNKNVGLTEIILQIDHRKQVSSALPVVKRILERNHGGIEDYQIIIPQELLHQADRTQQTFNLVLGSIAAISLLVGGIGIMNIMLATVSERTREIGIRRAVGANKMHIVVQFLTETLLLTLSGAILGVIVGVLFSLLISYVAGWNTIVKPWSVILSLTMATGVGLFSGLYPAFKAAAMNPIKALRHD